jgi:alpha-tubulin suppressor-like RCC1 family protein
LNRTFSFKAPKDPLLSVRVFKLPLEDSSVFTLTNGKEHICAATKTRRADSAGQVKCWGENKFRALGQNKNTFDSLGKTQRVEQVDNVSTHGDVINLASGHYYNCIITSDFVDTSYSRKNISCWGRSDKGQLGKKMTGDNNYIPEQVYFGNRY